jgi:hypothetical protein
MPLLYEIVFYIHVSVVAIVQFAFNLVQRVEEAFRGDGRYEEQDADGLGLQLYHYPRHPEGTAERILTLTRILVFSFQR